jgi:hypothetical protein
VILSGDADGEPVVRLLPTETLERAPAVKRLSSNAL